MMPMTSDSTAIVGLNNEAVSYLQDGNYRAAVWDLELSLERLRHLFLWEYIKPTHYDPSALRVTSVPIASADEPTESSNVFDFYRRAFRIVTSPSEQARIHPISNMIVIKYNMAIAYHDDAIRRNHKSHFYLALEMYEEIIRIMQDYRIRGHSLLLLAIGNNIGHIHSHLMNFQQTRDSLTWVKQLFLASRNHATSFIHEDYHFFNRTVKIFQGKDLTIAPAA